MEKVYLKFHPTGEIREVTSQEELWRLMAQGWHQVPAPAAPQESAQPAAKASN